ncbi:MaoC/PaaZ C-terminal domain-containing protein [Actinomycetaceae bacterium L2_0104]
MSIGTSQVTGVLKSAVKKKIRPVPFPADPGDLPQLQRGVEADASQVVKLEDFLAATRPGSVRHDPRDAVGSLAARATAAESAASPAAVAPALLHTLCFPTTLDLLTSPALPTQPLGLVVTSQSWTLFTPVHVGEPLLLNAKVTRLERNEDGVVLIVECVLSRNEEVCYVEQTRYLSRSGSGSPAVLESGRATSDSHAAGMAEDRPQTSDQDVTVAPIPDHRAAFGLNEAGKLDVGQRPALTTARFTQGAARQWAGLSGDANPIHLSGLAARAFGYRKALLHGAAIDAWAASTLGIDGEHPCSGAVSFRAPVLLPVDLELVPLEEGRFAVLEKRTGRDLVHLTYSGDDIEGANALEGGPGTILLPRREGRLSSTVVAQGMCAGAAAAFPRVRNVIEEASPWRRAYREAMTSLSGIDAPQNGPRCARDGLNAMHSLLHFADGRPIGQAWLDRPANSGGLIVGTAEPSSELELRFPEKTLRGDELLAELSAWQAAGTIQPGARSALAEIVARPEILDFSGYTFVCLGAGAELSPAPQLLRWGANVAAVMRPGTDRAKKLRQIADQSAGRLYIPSDDACDLVREPERVAGWAADLPGRLVVVETLYAPGSEFLLAAAGADIVEKLICAVRADTVLAWIGSPTDAYLLAGLPVSETLAEGRRVRVMAEGYARLRRLRPARIDGVYPGFVDVQGPNYAAAKRIGRWRATVERAEGRQISYNVGPMSLTRSVLDSGVLRAAYGGMEKLGMPALPADVSATLMAALLAWDLEHPEATAQSDSFLTDKAVDSGLLTRPYEPNGLMGLAVALGARQVFGKE